MSLPSMGKVSMEQINSLSNFGCGLAQTLRQPDEDYPHGDMKKSQCSFIDTLTQLLNTLHVDKPTTY